MVDEPVPGRTGAPADPHIAALVEIVERLEADLRQLRNDHKALAEQVTAETNAETRAKSEPAPWVWFTPPAAAEDDPDDSLDPRFTVDNFVAWHNITFVGVDGGRGRPIPECWPLHTGLAMEIATLAYTWREANIGANANARDAQQWLHQWHQHQ